MTPQPQPQPQPNPQFQILTSRSQYLDYRHCPRLRFWGYELFRGMQLLSCPTCGTAYPATDDSTRPTCGVCGNQLSPVNHPGGVAPIKKSIYLVTGQAVHVGLEVLLQAHIGLNEIIPNLIDLTESAVNAALALYDPLVASNSIHWAKTPQSQQAWKAQEQRALIEGFIRASVHRVLPYIIDRYRILEVEREDVTSLIMDRIGFQSRVDCLCEERETNDLHMISFKTTGEYTRSTELQFRHDVQGVTEAWGLEQSPDFKSKYPDRKISAVAMIFLAKGRELEDDANPGMFVCQNPLTRLYSRATPGITPDFDSYQKAWSYKTFKTYVKGSKKGESYIGYLEKDYEKTSSWHLPGGVKAWVDELLSGTIQPEMGDPFDKLFVWPEPWMRSDAEMEDFIEQLRYAENQISAHCEHIRHAIYYGNAKTIRTLLNMYFPQNPSYCFHYGAMCWAEGLCFGGGMRELDNPAGWCGPAPGLNLKLRTPHHELELAESQG